MCAQVRLFFCMYSNMLLQYRQLAEKNSGKWWIHETRHLGSVWPCLWELGAMNARAMRWARTGPHQLASVQRLDRQHAPSHTNWRQYNVWTGNTHLPTQTGVSATFGPATSTVPHQLASVQRLDRQHAPSNTNWRQCNVWTGNLSYLGQPRSAEASTMEVVIITVNIH